MFLQVLEYILIAMGSVLALYSTLLGLLTISWFQTHVVYLHAITMTRLKDLNVPETFGFLHNQVTPINIKSDRGTLYAWHVLPVELYLQHEQKLLTQPSGFPPDITSHLAF